MVFKTGLTNFIVTTNKKTWEVILVFLVLENEKKTNTNTNDFKGFYL